MEDIRIRSFISEEACGEQVDDKFASQYPLTVALVGSGNWACAIAKIVGANVKTNWRFCNRIWMYVHEEEYKGRKLSEYINEMHENPKYLPGHKLPSNVWACTDLGDMASQADILVFVMPHQFVKETCSAMKPHVKRTAIALSLIKGFLHEEDVDGRSSKIQLLSEAISSELSIECDVLMGANIASEVANGNFCEATLGSQDMNRGFLLKSLFCTRQFRVQLSSDKSGVEICGASKNALALGVGFLKGVDEGECAVALLIRRGMLEILRLLKSLSETYDPSTIIKSCGFADIIASCDGGRNARVAKIFAQLRSQTTDNAVASWDDLERTLLNGQKLQGVLAVAAIYEHIKSCNSELDYPLFVQIHRIASNQNMPITLTDVLRSC